MTSGILCGSRFCLCERSIPAVIISGNHDSPDRIAVGKSLLARHGIHIITELKDTFTLVEIGNIQIFPLPYFENAQMREMLGDETLRGAGACMRAAVEKMEKAFDPAKKARFGRALLCGGGLHLRFRKPPFCRRRGRCADGCLLPV